MSIDRHGASLTPGGGDPRGKASKTGTTSGACQDGRHQGFEAQEGAGCSPGLLGTEIFRGRRQ